MSVHAMFMPTRGRDPRGLTVQGGSTRTSRRCRRLVLPGLMVALVAASATAATITTHDVSLGDLATSKSTFSAPHGDGTNPFGYDWDAASPQVKAGAPAGFGFSSFYANVSESGATDADRYRTFRIGLRDLAPFLQNVTVGEIASISYRTRKPAPQTAIDWRLTIYTTPGDKAVDPGDAVTGPGDISAWYRNRIQSMPENSANLSAPANQWNTWSTAAGTNQLKLFTSRPGFMAEDIDWSELIAGTVTRGPNSWDFSSEEVMVIDLTLGANSGGGTGESQIDAIVITLTNGDQAILNLGDPGEGTLTVTFDKSCYKVGDTVTATISMKDLDTEAAGFQAFLSYDATRLTFDSWSYTSAPFGLAVIDSLAGVHPAPGQIDLASGIDQLDGQVPSMADADLVTLTFTVANGAADICSTDSLVTFRPHAPPTRITDISGTSLSLLTQVGSITIDTTKPTVTAGSIASCYPDVASAEAAAIAATTVSDNCTDTPDLVKAASTTGDCAAVITVTVTDCAGNVESVQYNTRIDNTPPVISCPVDANLTCAAPAVVHIAGTHTVPDANVDPVNGNYRPFKIDTSHVFQVGPGHPPVAVTGSVDISTLPNNSSVFVGLIAKDRYDAWVAANIPGANDPNNSVSGFFGFIDTAYLAVNTLNGGRIGLGQQLTFANTTQVYAANNLGTLVSGFVGMFDPAGATLKQGASTVNRAYTAHFDYPFWFANGMTGTPTIPTDWTNGAYAFVGTFFDKLGGAPVIDVTFTQAAIPDPSETGTATATDNCDAPGDVSITYTDVVTPGSCPQSFTIVRTWKATDSCGNIETCPQTITVNDNEAPVITCPTDVVVQCAADVPAPATDLASFIALAGASVTDCDPAPTVIHVGDTISSQTCPNSYTIARKYRATDSCGNVAECTQTITVQDTTEPAITCPASVTVQCAADVPPPATDLASFLALGNGADVSDNCDPAPTVIHVGDAIGTQTCANKYTITRTYRATDACGNQAECTQTITVDDTTPPVVTPGPLYFQGFEVDTDSWTNATRVPSGTNGVVSADGAFHAQAVAPTTPITYWGGRDFTPGLQTNGPGVPFQEYTTSIDIYLDVDGGWPNNTRFDFSSAINNSSGTHRRDFIFNAGFYNDATGPGANTNRFVISASFNSQPGSAYAKNPAWGPIAISTSGWYTFSHRFYNDGGVLAVEMAIHDSNGNLVNSWTRSDVTDLIGIIGGNRYGWFAFNEFTTLAFDNAKLTTTSQPDIVVDADAGGCTAVVNWIPPTATDNCSDPGSVTVISTHDPGDAFPVGTTPVTYIFTDECGNSTPVTFNVTVNPVNQMLVSLSLDGIVASPLTRCITFELFNCPSGTPTIVSQEITFVGGQAVNVPVAVPCGAYTCVTARDPLHTLRRTLDAPAFTTAGTQYVADFIAAGKPLVGGNLNDDPYVDILDFGVFAGAFATSYGTGDTDCATPHPHADISGNGGVYTEDFTFIQINFLKVSEENCCGAPSRPAGPRTTITVAELEQLGLSKDVDLNGDKVVDQNDVALWILGARPGQPLPAPAPAPRAKR